MPNLIHVRWLRLVAFALGVTLAVSPPLHAQEEEEEEPQYAVGLVATYRTTPETGGAGGGVATRIDDDVQFVWRGGSADPRLPAGRFAARWEGKLFTIAGGDYRFHIWAGGGRVRFQIGETELLAVESDTPAWHVSPPLKLGYAHSPLVLEFEQTGDDPQLRLDWSGPQFAVEPIPERHLFHEPKKSPARWFDEGRDLTRALRCGACHAMPDGRTALPAPALTHLDGNIESAWLVAHLTSTESNTAARRMPTLGIDERDARDIGAYLLSAAKDSAAVKVPKAKEIPPPDPEGPDGKKKKPKPRKDPNVGEGERLARSIGCLACHTVGPLGTPGLFSGGDLTAIARKRPAEFFVRWLEDPAKVNADHRMPVFKLSELERADLAVYLTTLRGDAAERKTKADGEANRGRELVGAHNCAACHRLPHEAERPALRGLDIAQVGCLGEPDRAKHRPGYRLDDAKRKSLVEYLGNASHRKPAESAAAGELDGAFVLRERNCTACHARGTGTGLADLAPKVTALDAVLLPVQAALLPPSLNGVGDKLTDESLMDAITLKHEPLRPWLRVRMPKFNLAEEEGRALRSHLVDHDRIPDLPPPAESASDDTAQRLAARRLVTSDGFGCTSCHKIGKSEPVGVVNVAAHGTDLTLLGERIRKPWFDRWVRNPARIIPRMEMPAIQLAVKGVLHDNVDEQLAAVWKVLNEPGFNPPPPNAVRIVRSRNLPEVKERANVLTDVFVVDEKTFVSPIVIGLPNRHNILFDLETNRLAAWWTGDTAAERTKGKSWYWEPGGAMVMGVPKAAAGTSSDEDDSLPEMMYGNLSNASQFSLDGQNVARLDRIVHTETGVAIEYRLQASVKVRQVFEPLPPDPSLPLRAGFRRTVEIENTEEAIYFNGFFDRNEGLLVDGEDRVATEVTGRPRFRTKYFGEANQGGSPLVVPTKQDGEAAIRLVLEYRVDLPIDTFPNETPAFPPPPAFKLDVVPGFDAMQLPLTVAEMPTGLAWRKDGSLVVASLKGRIFNARDTNGDSMEDSLQAISYDMATPYGLAVAEVEGADGKRREVVDVIDKTALVRLHDDDGDGFSERSEVVADGWGHTDDYHDWAVGLPKIPGGGYYVALPCQQDERDEAKAKWRGQGLRLLPRTPTKDDPRLFTVEPFCGGLRFPMGLALNKAGDLFASDNQGNYNPFNEINHLRDGKRFGFINKLEAKPEFQPPVESPAIELPHPYTRSVNGMCFLYTPEAHAAAGKMLFGPYEGQLVGCEYNDKSLFRMSLEKIGDTYQGAIYPMTVLPAAGAPSFEGPTVCEISPAGDLYVGNMQDSGWGGGRNTGSIVRLRPSGKWPAGIREIRARSDGFEIEFTEPVGKETAESRKNYSLEAFRRISTPQYGGNDVDRGPVKITKIEAADDGRSVRLTVDALKAGFCYEFHLANFAAKDTAFFPAEAFYTLKQVPQ